jgi:hypothetical protein
MKEFEYEGLIYQLGQNSNDNWKILDENKSINENFIWFHLDSFPSGYVILQISLEELKNFCIFSKFTEQDYLNYGATLCKENTKYRNLSNIKVVYTTLKKLKKTDKSGEIIISGKRKYIII